MNDKALLVMDMPEKGCICCVIGRNHSIPLETCIYCPISGKNAIGKEADKIPDWCPLKPIPEKRKADVLPLSPLLKEILSEYSKGWNACIDKILEGCRNG